MDVAVQLEPSTLAALDGLARQCNQPRDALVEEAPRRFLGIAREADRKIEAGIAAADRADFAREKEMKRIFSKYDAA